MRKGEREKRRKGEIFSSPLSPLRPVTLSPILSKEGIDFEKRGMGDKIESYKELRVYRAAMDTAMEIFELTKRLPPEERFSMVDQMRRSSRSVCANIAEAWRKRRYAKAFIAKLNDAEGEACETQVWVEFAERCRYLDEAACNNLDKAYDHIIGQLVRMIHEPDKWLIK